MFSASLFEQIKHIFQIKVDSAQSVFNQRTEAVFKDFKETSIKSQRMNYLYSSLDSIVATLAQIVLFVVGGMLVIRGQFTIGMFTIFSSYFRSMLSSCRYFFVLAAAYQGAAVSFNRIKRIVDCREETNGTTELKEINTIKMDNVCFSYETYEHWQKSIVATTQNEYNDDTNVIDFASHEFTKGKIYGIIGENGAGKTTFIKLLIGLFNDERAGNLYYNGIASEHVDLVQVRKNLIGYVEQDPSLFEDSIYYNLTYKSLPNNTDDYGDLGAEGFDRFMQLVHTLNMDEFLQDKTLAFRINENNTNLSGGEKQKIAILKLLWKNPDAMIFDEPTAALDYETKRRFLQHLLQIKKHKIIVLVTHDHEMLSCCDEIINFSKT